MPWNPNFDLFTEAFTETWVVGTYWVIPLILVFITLLIITRDFEKWKILAFPVCVMWTVAGVPISPIILVITAIVCAIEALSIQVIGNKIMAFRKKIKASVLSEEKTTRLKKLTETKTGKEKALRRLLNLKAKEFKLPLSQRKL